MKFNVSLVKMKKYYYQNCYFSRKFYITIIKNKFKLFYIYFIIKNKKFNFKQKKLNFNFNKNNISFQRSKFGKIINYFNYTNIKNNNINNFLQKRIEIFGSFIDIFKKKRSKQLKISKKTRRFLLLIPFFEFKVRLLLLSSFQYNIQKNQDFLEFLNLKFFYENSQILSEYYTNKLNQKNLFFESYKKKNFIHYLHNQITIFHSNKNKILNFTKKTIPILPNFNKKTKFFFKNHIDCIFVNLNHFLYQSLSSIKINMQNKKKKFNFFISCLRNDAKYFFYSWFIKFLTLAKLKSKKTILKFKKIKIFNFYSKFDFSDEFGVNLLEKKEYQILPDERNCIKFFMWGDPYLY